MRLSNLFYLLAVRAVTLSGASEGLEFYFKPDFSKVTGGVVLAAIGQAFFSLSLGMGAMLTYASYLSRDSDLPQESAIIATADFGVAFLAGSASDGMLVVSIPTAEYRARAAELLGVDRHPAKGRRAD